MTPDVYTGGYFETNAYALALPGDAQSCLLIDAPAGSADWLRSRGQRVAGLLLTHAHIDHVEDAARIIREHNCPIYHHADGIPLLQDTAAYRRFGLSVEFEPVTGGVLIDETTEPVSFSGLPFRLLLVPGHCPGSICFYHAESRQVFSGDTLFAGAVGRWDLPDGDRDLLLSGIKNKLLPLGDEVRVHAGHGPRTTIGRERATNPYLVEKF
ncbi:MAG: MBL fold metallo-hydrolase [Verrucomicrobia bacterium]|nr:MBL fold metallo-hydrolase [Verrucomicrobiota bacterium]MBV9656626.1 MBL fold metallo-hydrolase [Verrucomicrobiota bacterium]